MKWQVNTTLAYGGKGLAYFTYWTPDIENFRDGIIGLNEKRMAKYDAVAAISHELRNVGRHILGLTSTAVHHWPDAPEGAAVLPGDGLVASLDGGQYVVGEFAERNPGWEQHEEEMTELVNWLRDSSLKHPRFGTKLDALYKLRAILSGEDLQQAAVQKQIETTAKAARNKSVTTVPISCLKLFERRSTAARFIAPLRCRRAPRQTRRPRTAAGRRCLRPRR